MCHYQLLYIFSSICVEKKMTQDLLLPIYHLCTLFLPPLLLVSTLEKFQVHYIILIKIYCMEQNLDIIHWTLFSFNLGNLNYFNFQLYSIGMCIFLLCPTFDFLFHHM